MRKTRPVVVLSPDEMNDHLRTVLVAPLTSAGFDAPFRVRCRFADVSGQIALDHIRSLSKTRLLRYLGRLQPEVCDKLLQCLRELFGR